MSKRVKKAKEPAHGDLLLDLIGAWESLPGGQRYSPREVGQWLEHEMAPAFNRARRALGLPIPSKSKMRELPYD